MNDVAPNPYDVVAYPGHAFSQTHPAHLETIAHFHGMSPVPLAVMRVLELGCGRGGNLTPMAFQYPTGHFVGIDLSARAIEHARETARELGLANVDFRHLDIMSVSKALGEFDYIICHGVYSWVPPPVRDRIMAVFGELLSPQGIAYVSYNALPGCRMRDLARDVMLFQTRDISDPRERVRVARAALKTFAEATDPDSFYGAALRQRLIQLDDTPDDVLYHDDLNPGATAFAFHEVLDAAGRHGLGFLSETSFPNQFGAARGAAQQLLSQIRDPIIREQSLDLLVNRAFRETMLCRAGIPLKRGIEPGCLRPYHLSANVREAEGKDEQRPGVVGFSFAEGVRLSVDLHLAKAALRALGAAWPASIAYRDLVALAQREVAAELGPDIGRELARLDDALIAIFRAGLLDIHIEPPQLMTAISERPVASAFARWQAQSSGEVTDLRHRTVALDSIVVRKFLCLLDGTRTAAMLLAEMRAFLAAAHASGRHGAGLPATASAEEVDMHLQDVARLALLSG